MPERAGSLSPHAIFTVSDSLRYLEPQQIKMFLQSFDAWCAATDRQEYVRSRQRMRALFLLLRFTGARLGEVLALDDRTAFDFSRKTVCLGHGETERDVPLESFVSDAIQEVLESAMGCSLRGHFFHMDPGYVRRIFYARAMDCGLPKELGTPRVLRYSRALEMVRGGVPLLVVSNLLGHLSTDILNSFRNYSSDDVVSIVRKAHSEMQKKTSARNSFVGHVARVVSDGLMAEVEVVTESGMAIFSLITEESLRTLKLCIGTPVVATIKAPYVDIAQQCLNPTLERRNTFTCSVERIASTEVLSEVIGHLEDGSGVCSLVSTSMVKSLNLVSGSMVDVCFKELSVVLHSVH
ncbi:TOBE domain-containing protein [Halodesulfovibrio marinisediminis]|uniref:Molybdate transport system regulatory protein n=1 Tax=Halodesulfovibrio marinisediminis DSM 17456 TaxID=1121457 RepID=A0A1N6GX41_9BACT|nr:TOBE domain-containing protein [Halodesulfovibrio marinisediminis]SIO12118.1 molybdate transport system regulatory protein [Halodesulfovibrio marinisediminis DSM 17456]